MFTLEPIGPAHDEDAWYCGLAFGPDGTLYVGRLLRRLPERALSAWDPRARRARWVVPAPEAPADIAVARDGRWLATSFRERAWLWDAASGRQLGVLDERDGAYAPIASLPGDRLLAAAQSDHRAPSVALWDVSTRRLLGDPVAPLPSAAGTLAVDPAGTRVAVSARGGISLWDIQASRKLHDFGGVIGTHPVPGGATPLVFHPDGQRIVAGGISGSRGPVVFDASTGAQLFDVRGPKRQGDATALAVSPDGRWLVAAFGWQEEDHAPSRDVELRIWDLNTRRMEPRIRMDRRPLEHLAFSPDGSLLAGSSMAALHVWAVNRHGGAP